MHGASHPPSYLYGCPKHLSVGGDINLNGCGYAHACPSEKKVMSLAGVRNAMKRRGNRGTITPASPDQWVADDLRPPIDLASPPTLEIALHPDVHLGKKYGYD